MYYLQPCFPTVPCLSACRSPCSPVRLHLYAPAHHSRLPTIQSVCFLLPYLPVRLPAHLRTMPSYSDVYLPAYLPSCSPPLPLPSLPPRYHPSPPSPQAICEQVREQVTPVLASSKPAFLDVLDFEELNLGSIPPAIVGE